MAQVEAIKPEGDYREIIQVNVPVRFYWNPEGTFDGIEFGPFEGELMPWEIEMLDQCLQSIVPGIGEITIEDEATA